MSKPVVRGIKRHPLKILSKFEANRSTGTRDILSANLKIAYSRETCLKSFLRNAPSRTLLPLKTHITSLMLRTRENPFTQIFSKPYTLIKYKTKKKRIFEPALSEDPLNYARARHTFKTNFLENTSQDKK